MGRNHTERVLYMLIDRAKLMLEEVDDAILERPSNASFVAYFDDMLAI